MRAIIHRRLKTPHRHLLDVKSFVLIFNRNTRAKRIGIFAAAFRNKRQKMIALQLFIRLVSIDKSFHVDVIDHQIQVTVIVQIRVSRPV